ncbi:MAG: sigma-54-dependent Fis family transcriptional regulator [Bacteroidetes bacterium]|nr:MAG: sigma-54-dependent Fis family transcriptional regulator [Bacteroidota bacterium]RLD96210.1 MAG: sigma-54-dependent Fis family transcriptional regulator [Bacteroidota bacterium]
MARKEGSILIVDDNSDLLIALRLILSRTFTTIDILKNPNLILSTLEKQAYDIILLDMNFKAGQNTGNEGIFWMNKILEKDPEATVVFITAYGDVELAIKSMKEGAVDFIMKSWDEQKILSTLQSAFELRKSKMQVSLLKKKQAHLSAELEKDHLVCYCHSSSMKALNSLVSKVAGTDASVLILGENGTGKEVVAREIHRLSSRKNEIFMKVDLGALPETLFESELFGHVKGAFTDAKEERDGRFVIASGGTLFLDEIGNLPPGLQSKLLSVLQNNEIYQVGSSIPKPIDVRIITATNMPLQKMIGEKTFREDLYYRINAIEMEIPPLRNRQEDIPVLAEFFLRKYSDHYNKTGLKLSDKAMEQLLSHPWPGNIRELEHAMEKAVILSEKEAISNFTLTPRPESSKASSSPATLNLEVHEKMVIQQAMREQQGNISAAAKVLGINRSTLYQKMKKYGV